jgi:hypothetical protein
MRRMAALAATPKVGPAALELTDNTRELASVMQAHLSTLQSWDGGVIVGRSCRYAFIEV